ncbi:MAG TPA: transporter [Verrucomicrobiales bacterium]|nr:transporter [Verrucomicrobiales bacterium]
MVRFIFTCATVLLVAGCASTPETSTKDITADLPAQWSNVPDASGKTPTFWWQNFQDEALIEAIGHALDANPNLNAAAARLDAAWAQARMVGADQLPQIALSSGLSMSQMNMAQFGVNLPGLPTKFDSQRHNLTLGAQWEIDLWSRVRSGKRAARSNALSQAADFAGALHSLAGQVAKAWMLAIEARQQERLAKFTVTTYETTVERIRARFEQGVRSSLDLRLAGASLAGAKANVAERITAANRATRQLELLLGRIPSNKQIIPEMLPSMPAAVPAGVPAKLLARRPDLVAAEHRLSAARASVRQAKAALYPQISLTASSGTSTSDLSDLVSGDSVIWTVGANLMQPVFQGGRLRQKVNMQSFKFNAAEAGFRSAVLNALGEVENALDAESHLAVMDESLGEAHKQSQAAAQIAQERYDRGLENIITLLEARRRAIDAESRWWSVRRLRLDNRINLHLALGGGFKTI